MENNFFPYNFYQNNNLFTYNPVPNDNLGSYNFSNFVPNNFFPYYLGPNYFVPNNFGIKKRKVKVRKVEMPDDCFRSIFEYFPIKDLLKKVILVSKEFYSLVHSSHVLKSKLFNDLKYSKYFNPKSLNGKRAEELKELIKSIICEKVRVKLPHDSNEIICMGGVEFESYVSGKWLPVEYDSSMEKFSEYAEKGKIFVYDPKDDEYENFFDIEECLDALGKIVSEELPFIDKDKIGNYGIRFIADNECVEEDVGIRVENQDYFYISLNPESKKYKNIVRRIREQARKIFSKEKFGIFICHPYLSDGFVEDAGYCGSFSPDSQFPVLDKQLICSAREDILFEKIKNVRTFYFYENLIGQGANGLSIWKLKASLKLVLEVSSSKLEKIYFEYRLSDRCEYNLKDKEKILPDIRKSIFEDLGNVFGERAGVKEISKETDIKNKTMVFEVKRESTEKVLKLYFVFFDGNPKCIENLGINIYKTAHVALNLIYRSKELKTNWEGCSNWDLPPLKFGP